MVPSHEEVGCKMSEAKSAPVTLSTSHLKEVGSTLRECIGMARTHGCLGPFVYGVAQVLDQCGIAFDRINLPASRLFGFRHPIYSFANLTWLRDSGLDLSYLPHRDDDPKDAASVADALKDSPYHPLVVEKLEQVRIPLRDTKHPSKRIQQLSSEGYEDYVAMGLSLPNGTIQPISIASRSAFDPSITEHLTLLEPLLSSGVDALYQGFAATHLAQSYIGRITGPKVLAGDFVRGNTQKIEAGILFCDIRGFTALTQKLGAEGIVPVVNCIFDVIGPTVRKHGGEILKFIGDAMLLIFPADDNRSQQELCDAMVEAVQESVDGVRDLGKNLKLDLSVGFGGHVGEVLYGNIGTEERLDFTVMGPAVNLASRLESLCKNFDVSAVFSDTIAGHSSKLKLLGQETVKGIEEPIDAWGIKVELY